MTTYSNSTIRLVTFHVGAMSSALALAAIEQFGGETAFYAKADSIIENGFDTEIGGFSTEEDFEQFFTDNHQDILSFVTKTARKLHFSCSFDMIAGLESLNGLLTMEDIAVGLYDDDSENRMAVARAVTQLVGQSLAHGYERQMEFVKTAQAVKDRQAA